MTSNVDLNKPFIANTDYSAFSGNTPAGTNSTNIGSNIAADSLKSQLIDPNVAATLVNDAAGQAFWKLAGTPGGLDALRNLMSVVNSAGGKPAGAVPQDHKTIPASDALNQIAPIFGNATDLKGSTAFNALAQALGSTTGLSGAQLNSIKSALNQFKDDKIDAKQLGDVLKLAVAGAKADTPVESGYVSGLRSQLANLGDKSPADINKLASALSMLLGVPDPTQIAGQNPAGGVNGGPGGTINIDISVQPGHGSSTSPTGGTNYSTINDPVKANPTGLTQVGNALVFSKDTYSADDLRFNAALAKAAGQVTDYGYNANGDYVVKLAAGGKGADGLAAMTQQAKYLTSVATMAGAAANSEIANINASMFGYQQARFTS